MSLEIFFNKLIINLNRKIIINQNKQKKIKFNIILKKLFCQNKIQFKIKFHYSIQKYF